MRNHNLTLRTLTLLFLSSALAFPLPAGADYPPRYGWGPGMMGWGGMGWLGPLGMILFWILVLLLIVWLAKSLWSSSERGRGAEKPPEESAMEVLKKRYARGEIRKEEYLEKKRDLE